MFPQSRGGTEGPVVDLCGECHQSIHTSAKAMRRGKSGDDALAHLNEDAKERARTLIQMILLVDTGGNPRPLLAVTLDSPVYLDALKRYQKDKGFSSQASAINGIMRALAIGYGLQDDARKLETTRIKISQVSKK